MIATGLALLIAAFFYCVVHEFFGIRIPNGVCAVLVGVYLVGWGSLLAGTVAWAWQVLP
jgi:drug/metabolite transporter (DMT)-like permease